MRHHVLIPNEQHAGAASAILMLLMMMMITPAAGAICPSTSIINTPNTVWEAVDCSNVTNLVVQTTTNVTIRIINSSTIASYFLPYNLSLIVLNSATISGLSLEILSSNITASSLLVFPFFFSVYIHSSAIYAANVGYGAIALRSSLNSSSDAHDINVTVDSSYIRVTSQRTDSHESHAFLHILASGSLRNVFVVMRNSSLNGVQSSRESKALYFIDLATDHASSTILIHLVDCAMNIGSTLVSTNPIDEVTDYGSVVIGLRFYANTLGMIVALSGVDIMLTRLDVIGNATSTFTFVSFEGDTVVDSSVIVLQSVYVSTTVAGPMSIANDMFSRYSSVFSAATMVNSTFLVRNTHIFF
ncbi:GPI-anchored surface protein, putative [Bodo saltans]|uniref:GPI-anchored surface protein, putative n=1 Tax=Bodo saltans TaxID=75058 RepID=A0A0S4JBG8_BODSA|nr:GPI-anchored surface protein, putative [Bodo saltans]|eukprot:CUG87439.1 GPI-anchored surface protein, putative [Bodo saltans]